MTRIMATYKVRKEKLELVKEAIREFDELPQFTALRLINAAGKK